jgi:hydrogenase maturation factor
VVPEAIIAARHGASAMHDPTEGGIRAALHEVAFASGVRLDIDLDQIPVFPPTAAICRHYGIDPLGLIGSGALLVTVAARRTPMLLRAWARRGITGHVIGAVGTGHGVEAIRGGRRVRFPWLARDEIITALGRRRLECVTVPHCGIRAPLSRRAARRARKGTPADQRVGRRVRLAPSLR